MHDDSVKDFYLRGAVTFALISAALLGCGQKTDPRTEDIQARLARLQRVDMVYDASTLPAKKKQLLQNLIEAGKLINEAYLRQMSETGAAVRDSLARRDEQINKDILRLVIRNGGPFDKMDHFKNFLNDEIKPPGAGFYPSDLSKVEFENYLALHYHQSASFLSPFTVIRRDKKKLKSVPFHEEYQEWLLPAAELLEKSVELCESPSLKTYLKSRAEALRTDDYFQSHLDWLDVTDSDIDVLMAPDEVYDDALMGIKASYEVSVMIKDSAESANLNMYTKYLDILEQNLPLDDSLKRAQASLLSPMEIVIDIYRGGDIATGYQAVAATLPNDPHVQSAKGTKKIFWRNVMAARVENIIIPIGRELIASDQIEHITPQAVFANVLLHEMSHSLGPRFVRNGSDSVSVNQALKDLYSAIEETKADVVGLHSMKYFLSKGVVPKQLEKNHAVSMLSSLFRSIRFGTSEAHGQASLVILNFLLDNGAVRLDTNTKKWSVVFERFGPAVTELARQVLIIEARGSYAEADTLLKKWGSMPKEIEESIRRLDHLPVDIEPVYSVKWE